MPTFNSTTTQRCSRYTAERVQGGDRSSSVIQRAITERVGDFFRCTHNHRLLGSHHHATRGTCQLPKNTRPQITLCTEYRIPRTFAECTSTICKLRIFGIKIEDKSLKLKSIVPIVGNKMKNNNERTIYDSYKYIKFTT